MQNYLLVAVLAVIHCGPVLAALAAVLISAGATAASPVAEGARGTMAVRSVSCSGLVQDNIFTHVKTRSPGAPSPPGQVTSDELVDTVLAASRALVAVAARSLAAAGDEVTLPQYRALVVLTAGEPRPPPPLPGTAPVAWLTGIPVSASGQWLRRPGD